MDLSLEFEVASDIKKEEEDETEISVPNICSTERDPLEIRANDETTSEVQEDVIPPVVVKIECDDADFIKTDAENYKREEFIIGDFEYPSQRAYEGVKSYEGPKGETRIREAGSSNLKQSLVNNEKYKCDLCQRSFKEIILYENHMALKCADFKCHVCPKSFTRKQTLRFHELRHMDKFKCKMCNKMFWGVSQLQEHMVAHKITSSYECNICQKKFNRRRALQIHKNKHVDKYKCPVCDKMFPEYNLLETHLSSHEFKCPACDLEFTSLAFFQQHLDKHTGRESECILCLKSFSSKRYLQDHMSIKHRDTVKFYSSVKAKTEEEILLQDISKVQTPNSTKPFSCEICGKAYKHSKSVKSHMSNHLKMKLTMLENFKPLQFLKSEQSI